MNKIFFGKIIGGITTVCLIIGSTISVSAVTSEDNSLSLNTQLEIDRLLNECPEAEVYIEDVVYSCIKNLDMPEAENQILEAINGVRRCNAEAIERVAKEQMPAEPYLLNGMPRSIDYDVALTAYVTGIALVKQKGCSQTAAYMEHAIVPQETPGIKPADYTHNYDSWADDVCYSPTFQGEVTKLFESQILGQTPGAGGTVTGNATFNAASDGLDLFAALHSVNFSVSFIWRAQGGYDTIYYVTDIYDFKFNEDYNDFEVNFGNNYCYAMQVMGWIQPFSIIIHNANFR